MTAINCVPQGKVGYLYTDTAHTHLETGEVVFLGPKMLIGRSFPWAIGITGFTSALGHLMTATNVEPPKNVVGLVRALPDIVARTVELAGAPIPGDNRSLGLTVLVWDARKGCTRVFLIDNDGSMTGGLGVSPFEAVEVDWSATGAAPDYYLGRQVNVRDRRSFDPHADGIALMEGQRREMRWGPTPTALKCARIGGEIQVAKVTGAGVQHSILHQWPDFVGERIAA